MSEEKEMSEALVVVIALAIDLYFMDKHERKKGNKDE